MSIILLSTPICPSELQGVTLKLNSDAVVGNGSFGVVFEAKIVETGETVAIKKVLQDKRFRNRELQIMKQLHHPNIVALKHYFYQSGEKVREMTVCCSQPCSRPRLTVYRVLVALDVRCARRRASTWP